MVRDVDHDHHPLELVSLLYGIDIILVEGFKRADLPKIEVFRPENGKPPACRNDRNLLAVVSDEKLDWRVPRYAATDSGGLADFIIREFKLDSFVDMDWERSAFG